MMRPIVYLDQNAWIALAQGAWDRDKYPSQHAALSHVIDGVRSDRLVIPLSFTNLFETLKINDPVRRKHLAFVQSTLSSGMVFRGRRRILEETMLQCFSDRLSLSLPSPAAGWFLSTVFFEAAGDYTTQRFGSDVAPRMVELIRQNPQSALHSYLGSTDEVVRRTGVKEFSSASLQLLAGIETRRSAVAGQSSAVRRRAYSAKLLFDELDFVFSLAVRLGLGWSTVDDIGPSMSKALVSDVPILNVERELVLRLEDQKRPINENDLRDVLSFSTALPLADVFVGEKLLVNVARQARLDEKYATLLLTSVKDLVSVDL